MTFFLVSTANATVKLDVYYVDVVLDFGFDIPKAQGVIVWKTPPVVMNGSWKPAGASVKECGFVNRNDWSGWKAEVPQATDTFIQMEWKHIGGLEDIRTRIGNIKKPGWKSIRSSWFLRAGEDRNKDGF